MVWLFENWQWITAVSLVAIAAVVVLRQAIVALRSSNESRGCGTCSHCPEERSDSAPKITELVHLSDDKSDSSGN